MKILVVDDSKAMRMIVIRSLRQAGFSKHTFEEASSGDEALKMILGGGADFVLTDWNMPGMSGMELLRKLRERGSTVGVGFVTSESADAVMAEAEEAGAKFLISKPFTAEALEAELGPYLF